MLLKDLLKNDHPLFTLTLQQLERATGNAGVDTRLIADITHKAHEIMRVLSLDPADTTGLELYNALNASIKKNEGEAVLAASQFVLLDLGDGPISFNLQDIVENAHHELPYDKRQKGHAQRCLRLEIVKRYAAHDRTSDELVYSLARQADLMPSGESESLLAQPKSTTKAPYILAIGDIFTDAFIKLRDDKARIDIDPDGSKRLSMEYGTKPPYERVDIVQAVGPSPNAAVACSRLGVNAGLMAFLGDDVPGKDSLTYLQTEGIDTSTMSVQQSIKSNYYYVLRYGADRTILVRNEAYDYQWKTPKRVPDWLYLSLISKSAWQLHKDMLAYLDEHPLTKLAFQPGTFHFEWGIDKLAPIYKRAYIVVLNREEAHLVTGNTIESIPRLATGLHALGPEVVIITDGPDGAYASYNEHITKMPNYPDPAPPFDRTGAGDAFASTIVAALALGESIETALMWAPINSMSVVQQLGAQAGLLHREELETYLQNAPTAYKPETIV